ncbi:mucin-1-like [Hyposmocoma kahamanoa]|uniref:mucin-1-like n=1 Tax=Hyposmocoma kahamanoa TaxID=1477025 RepID=UPI000E6D7FDF|nr:mucin-1-like [Hyposmocoma kahamanoa]
MYEVYFTPIQALIYEQAFGRRGLFAGRTRPSSTTPAPAQDASSAPAGETPAPRPRLRPGLRRTTSTTAAPAPAEDSTAASSAAEPAETTLTPSRSIGRGRPGVRPAPASLRPGPRLNLRANPRLRPGLASVAPDAAAPGASEAPTDTTVSDNPATDADSEGSLPTAAPAAEPPRGGLKLRTRLAAPPSPKPRAPVTPPPRRHNPLLKRKLATTEQTTTEAAKKSSSETTEVSTDADKSEAETDDLSVETTAAPAPLRGLDALFARRRAAAAGRPARPVRGALFPK